MNRRTLIAAIPTSLAMLVAAPASAEIRTSDSPSNDWRPDLAVVFERVRTGMISQGGRCTDESGQTTHVAGGRRSPTGWLFRDPSIIEPQFQGRNYAEVLGIYGDAALHDDVSLWLLAHPQRVAFVNFLGGLEVIHDRTDPADWHDALDAMADAFELRRGPCQPPDLIQRRAFRKDEIDARYTSLVSA